MKNCTYCGRENQDDAAQCCDCGTAFVTELTVARDHPKAAPEKDAPDDKRILSGALWCIGGILVTLLTYLSAASSREGGTYIVAWGAVLFGALRVFQGLRGRNTKPNSDDIGYAALDYGTKLERQGRVQEALVVYQTIIDKCPHTDASHDAKKSIESLQARLG